MIKIKHLQFCIYPEQVLGRQHLLEIWIHTWVVSAEYSRATLINTVPCLPSFVRSYLTWTGNLIIIYSTQTDRVDNLK